jgi:AraC-like DNA-binding protein
MSRKIPIIRLAHPLAFAAYLQDIGAPVDRYFRNHGLPALCKDPVSFVPLNSAWGLFGEAQQNEAEEIGWLVGRFVGDNNLNAALLNRFDRSPTLYQALKNLIRMVSTEASHLQLGIIEQKDRVLFHTRYPGRRDEFGYLVSQAYQLSVYIDVVRHFAGFSWAPDEIGIESDSISTETEKLFPQSAIRFNQPAGYISIPREVLSSRPWHLHSRFRGSDTPTYTHRLEFPEQLELLLEPKLSEGYLSMKQAARYVDMSVRTLGRRLSDSGATYQSVIDTVRFRMARRLIENSDQPMAAIAKAIGFEEQTNFTRMFRRISGMTPMEFRQSQKH